MNWRPRVTLLPTIEGWGLAFIAVCLLISSFIQRVNLLVLVFGLLVAILFTGAFVARRNLIRLEVRRLPPGHAFVGKLLEVAVEVVNRGTRDSLAATVEDGNDLPEVPSFEVNLPRMRRQATTKAKYAVTPARRGRLTLGPLTLLTSFPFGLFTARRTTDSFAEVVVVPPIGEMPAAWRPSTAQSSNAARTLRPAIDRMIKEFPALRDYRAGDKIRHIHWLSTARRGQPV